GVVALMYSGWLGGSLVYKYRVGVDEPVVAAKPEAPEAPDVEERRAA
ncbi:MAG: hypothetical protein H7338_14190, partial [Candidatus Sericytochromatia bacterium]|nr:hypothetical protein [Candidatus Sericytochromatia bacterium]